MFSIVFVVELNLLVDDLLYLLHVVVVMRCHRMQYGMLLSLLLSFFIFLVFNEHLREDTEFRLCDAELKQVLVLFGLLRQSRVKLLKLQHVHG